MDKVIRFVAILGLVLCANVVRLGRGWADEGMIPMSELSRIDLSARGIELPAEQIFNPQATSLVDGVCRVNGCTGSFVSPTGLIITNHHCAYGAIQKASTADRDYLQQGFRAKSLAEELPAADYTVRVTEDYRDVSADVLSAVTDGMTYLERTRAIEKRSKELEVAAEQQHPGLRAEVAEMFAGKTYVLFLYTYLKDIRLAFAPPQSIGNFGGEEDNWMWPRHTGDFSFMRAYTAPDGSSATYAPENIPYRPKRFIQVQPQGVQDGDAVFLLGYPGRTARHKTAAFLEYEQNVRLPTIVELYNWQMQVLSATAEKDRDVEIKHASRMRSLANVEKRSRGQLKGLKRAGIIPTRFAHEKELQAYIMADVGRREKYGDLLQRIEDIYQEMATAAAYEILLDQLRTACRTAAWGFFVYDATVERQKDDLDRESIYMDRNWQQSVQQVETAMGDYHAETDQILLAGMLERLSNLPTALENPALAPLLKNRKQIPTLASARVAASRLGDVGFVQQCLQKTPAELRQLDDPMLELVISLYPTYMEMRELDKAREGQLGQLYGALIEVKQQFMQQNFIPDANATLRLTSGHIRGYSPEDAVIKTPITTFSGVIDKTTGVEPFITPQVAIEKYTAGKTGTFRNAVLDDVPVAILYDADTTGGNSGSPILNGRGELVGVNFDRCFEATINDFAWDQSYSRSIGVDIRYVLWVTGIVYGAQHLLDEMGVR